MAFQASPPTPSAFWLRLGPRFDKALAGHGEDARDGLGEGIQAPASKLLPFLHFYHCLFLTPLPVCSQNGLSSWECLLF